MTGCAFLYEAGYTTGVKLRGQDGQHVNVKSVSGHNGQMSCFMCQKNKHWHTAAVFHCWESWHSIKGNLETDRPLVTQTDENMKNLRELKNREIPLRLFFSKTPCLLKYWDSSG